MKNRIMAMAMGLCMGSGLAIAAAATLDDVDNSFYPYKNGVPKVEGVTPGTVINAKNWQVAKDVLDPAMLKFIQDGAYEIKVGATYSLDLNQNYVKATRDNLNKTKLGAKPGELTGFVAGRPFPEEPSASDPRAGEKLAWNYKYGINWGDSAAIYPFYWKFRDLQSGKLERTIKFNFHFLNFKHRIAQSPVPEFTDNPGNLFRGIYVQVLEPYDIQNTQLLILRYDDDTMRDDAWLYLGFQRRVRRLGVGQVTDSFLGSDLMVEDFEGYNGRVSDMTWTYKGTKTMLMPYYKHNEMKLATDLVEPDGYKFIDFGGKGTCFPNISWQLRKVYVVEAVPTDKNHPISKRIFYMDAQTGTLNRTLIYDRKGDLWKSWTIGKSHPDFHLAKNKGSGVSIDDSFSMIDVQSGHCTTGQFKGQVDPALNPRSKFSVQNMRASGK
jgi:hypothetical protein